MILQQLTLRNFGVYGGEQVFDLAPARKRNRTAPIILFGGINGGGKTTILDAIQLVLYGNRARCSKRGDRPYDEFLSASIHHGTLPGEGAAIELSFSFTAEGQEHLYDVTRLWSSSGNRTQERVVVAKDGEPDGWLSDNWHQVVEELIPFGVAQLCFFDAEKIRFLAEDETSSEALGVAIKSLLGLDLAERLIADAGFLEGRLAKRSRKSPDLTEAERLEAELAAKQADIEVLHQERASIENTRQAAARRLQSAEEQFAKVGGKLWTEREERQRRRGELDFQIRDCEERLVELSAGDLPLALVSDLLQDACRQAQAEHASRETEIVARLLGSRDEMILEVLREEKVKGATIKLVASLLEADRAKRGGGDAKSRLMLSEGGRDLLEHLTTRGLTERLETATKLLTELDTGRRALEQVQRSLAATPDEESIRGVAAELKDAAGEMAGLKQQVDRLEKQLAGLRSEHGEIETVLRRLRRKVVDEEIRTEEDGRVAGLLQRTQETMRQFLRLSTSRKIDRLSEFVTDSFRFLLRKKTLVRRVLIDPETFAITLVDDDGRRVSKDRLSEGEKQIFAISVLWGLSRASARPLPAIIDTPMARLDVEHRNHLVERYFPNASHQVVILSTDTEIERTYFDQLRPFVAHAYLLNYDEATKATVPTEGYFWDKDPTGQVQEVSA
ncbi:MAG: DNA sulfur modification protein DndD [Planctomycetia bacterium]|nr:DNA sulfur modification protein DndD [Planctomycetia bacterium]